MSVRKNKAVGVLMLNTRFPRLSGDIGNPESFNYPVLYETIDEATPSTVITPDTIEEAIANDLIDKARLLQTRGATLISTSCGFLSPLQDELAASVTVPVLSSSLLLLPLLNACYGKERVGVLTFDAEKLSDSHLFQHTPAAIEGLRAHDSLRETIEQDHVTLNPVKAQAEVSDACIRLLQRSPSINAIILECTNLSPYKDSLRTQFGVSVYDIVDAIHWMLESQ